MKRLLPALLAVLLLLSGCGGSSGSNSAAAGRAPMEPQSATGSTYNYSTTTSNKGWTGGAEMEMVEDAKLEETGAEAPADPLANTKIIYTADLELETKDFDTAGQALDRLVEELGGYYESRSLNQGGSYRRLYATVRVPAGHFADFLRQAGEVAHLTSCNEYKEDVSEVYYDHEARLTTQQTKLERLHKLLEQAATMEDIISLETAISDTELQIEYLTGSLRKYDSLINYSTISVNLYEVYRLSTDEEAPLTFGQRLSSALNTGLDRGIDNLEDLTISLARNWMTLLLLAAVAAGVITLLRRRSRRREGGSAGRKRLFSRSPKTDAPADPDDKA